MEQFGLLPKKNKSLQNPLETSINCTYPLETPERFPLAAPNWPWDALGLSLVADLVAVLLQQPGGQRYHMIALSEDQNGLCYSVKVKGNERRKWEIYGKT